MENWKWRVRKIPYERVSHRELAHDPTSREATTAGGSAIRPSLVDVTGSSGGLTSFARDITSQTLLHPVDCKNYNKYYFRLGVLIYVDKNLYAEQFSFTVWINSSLLVSTGCKIWTCAKFVSFKADPDYLFLIVIFWRWFIQRSFQNSVSAFERPMQGKICPEYWAVRRKASVMSLQFYSLHLTRELARILTLYTYERG
jgi:hypothetical protein